MRRVRDDHTGVPDAAVLQRRGQRIQRDVHDAHRVQHADVGRRKRHPHHAVPAIRLAAPHATNVHRHRRLSHYRPTG